MIRDDSPEDELFWRGYQQAANEGWADIFTYDWYLQDRLRPVAWTGGWPPPLTARIREALIDAPSSYMDDVHSRLVQR